MRILVPLTVFLFSTIETRAQGYAVLDVNDIRMPMHSNGIIGVPYSGFLDVGFVVPPGTPFHILGNAGLWFSGVTPVDSARVAIHLYNSPGRDFFPGPLRNDGSAGIDPTVAEAYDHVWSISRADIIAHLSYFACMNDPDCDVALEYPFGYSTPSAILDWPAQNSSQGHDPFLAPFFDNNGDGSYDPLMGDAPCILGDQALFLVYNDMLQPHGASGGEGVGLEVQVMPFGYTGASLALEQTIFMRYRVINRGTTVYSDAFIGFFNEFDIGCSNDDFIGTDPSRNLFYAYNWDDNDDCPGVGYGPSPPAFGMAILKGPRVNPDASDNPDGDLLPAWNGAGFGDGLVDNERHGLSGSIYWNREGPTVMTDPTSTEHYRQYMEVRWKDGLPMTYGGNGYSTDPDATPSRFMFPGLNDPVGAGTSGMPQAPWAEVEPTPALPDRRGLMTSGPFTFEPGEHLDLLFAYVYARSNDGAQASVAALQARTDSVIAFAATLPIWDMADNASWSLQCEDYLSVTIAERQHRNTLVLYPSPTQDAFHFDAPTSMAGAQLVVRDVTGREVLRQGLVAGLNRVGLKGATPGVYICEAATVTGRYTGRVVKE